jgi:Glycine/sarcosine/betaine reductase selenoprotein B (GRDB)
VLIDSFKFLPRSFLPLYEDARPIDGERDPVWAPFAPRLADASIALVTSAGLSLAGEQEPFDLDGERRRPSWGDPSYRVLPDRLSGRPLAMSHLHVNPTDILADHNVALPVDVLDELVASGRVGRAAPAHVSVMGYQEAGLAAWRTVTAPAVAELFRAQRTDGVVLAPV